MTANDDRPEHAIYLKGAAFPYLPRDHDLWMDTTTGIGRQWSAPRGCWIDVLPAKHSGRRPGRGVGWVSVLVVAASLLAMAVAVLVDQGG